jgi:hypothetical protein
LKKLAVVVGGLGVAAVTAQPAQAARWRVRRGYYGRRRIYGVRRPFYPGGFGYGGVYGPGVYNRGYFGAPFLRAPVVPAQPYLYPPVM